MSDDELIELLGIDEDPLLGARVPSRRGRRINRSELRRALVPKTPGVARPGGRLLMLGFDPIQFTDASALTLFLTAEPQRPFKGGRLVIDAVRSASGIGGLLTVSSFMVGQVNQLVSAEPIILAAFEPDATLVEIGIDPATPGIDIIIGITCSVAPTTAATVDVGAALFGLSVG